MQLTENSCTFLSFVYTNVRLATLAINNSETRSMYSELEYKKTKLIFNECFRVSENALPLEV
jgi:hypothetical protein